MRTCVARLQLLVGALLLLSASGEGSQLSSKVTEHSLRTLATVAPKPSYPAASVRAKATGVAVASVVVGTDGKMSLVDVLEAPDAHIRQSVAAALSEWRVQPYRRKDEKENREMISRLVFYFVIRKQAMVLNPDEVAGGPAWNLSPLSSPDRRVVITPQRPSIAEPIREISIADLKTLRGPVVILDIGTRDEFLRQHHPGAVNIPMEELLVRAGIELPRERYVVVDCRREPKWYPQASAILGQIGFGRIVLLMP